ncbi:MAG: redox-regulated ATPase YchF [Candidatus Aenigmarchaeota archaeon ex4484_224]|nr:MAG: redox-regulated ATPase YchF [Candidatus Aenigmarchaeota archaeon ex4484_224]
MIGLVGKPSAGKSSFFKAATMIEVAISSIPFTTIKPNVGIAYVSIDCVCKEFGVKCNPRQGFCLNGKRFIPIKLIDVGGLIPGSHLGRGIGNKFLDELRQADGLIQIVDLSGLTDEEGKPTSNFDPEIEIKFLEDEINKWFYEVIERNLKKIRNWKRMDKNELKNKLFELLSGLQVKKEHIEIALEEVGIENLEEFSKRLRELAKPILICGNKIDLKEAQKNYERLKEKYKNLIPVSAEAEIALKKAAKLGLINYLPGNGFEIKGILNEAQRKGLEKIKEIIKKFGSTGVQECLNKIVFEILNFIAVYPVADVNKLTDKKGNVLPDVFLVEKGTKLKEFAFKIHSEIGEKFIAGIDARTKRKLSGDYELKHRDVIEIKHR